jgi:hypothetical protein
MIIIRHLNRFFGDTKPNLVSNDYSTLVIFIIGGVTSHEIQLVHEFGQQIKKQVRGGKARILILIILFFSRLSLVLQVS